MLQSCNGQRFTITWVSWYQKVKLFSV